jgi:hypothetical protein
MRRLCALGLVLALALSHGPAAVAQKPGLDDLMMDLNIAPMDPQAPPALSVTRLGTGGRVTLGDLKGSAVLVYFWATW